MSTPFGKRGFFWEAWAKGGAGWEQVAVPATECARISARVSGGRAGGDGGAVVPAGVLCEFVETEDAVFGRELVERAITPDLKPLF